MINIFLTSSFNRTYTKILEQIDKTRFKNVLFIHTAAELEAGDRKWLETEHNRFRDAGFEVARYTLTAALPERVAEDVGFADIVYIGGGNPFYLLHQIHLTNFIAPIKKHIAEGKVYIGESSGALVASPSIELARRPEAEVDVPELKSYAALGLIDFLAFPHWGSDITRDNYLKYRIPKAYREDARVILMTNSQFIAVRDDNWIKIVDVDTSDT